MVGKSTRGSGATGRLAYASSPASRIAAASRLLATRRRMNGAEIFTSCLRELAAAAAAREVTAQAIHVEVDDGRRVEREHLRDQEAAHDGDAERPPELGAHAAPERERQRGEQRRHR